jgi:DnaJ-class molecular chaperone
MRDPYETLGVARTASADDIRQAYRKLAKASHPDLHPGDAKAEARFKDISVAYDILSDPAKRVRFDKGEIDATGNERPQHAFYRGFADGPAGAKYATSDIFGADADLESVFRDLFGGASARGGRGAARGRGGDIVYSMEIGLVEAARGGKHALELPDGRRIDVNIPAGIESGTTLRLQGMGSPGIGGGTAGDAFIEVRIRSHPVFELKEGDIHLDLPVTLAEAALGAKVTVPTVRGPVTMTIPKGSSSGATLRLKGKGMPGPKGQPAGDQYVRLKIVLPREIDPSLAEAIRAQEAKRPYDPRAEVMREAGA